LFLPLKYPIYIEYKKDPTVELKAKLNEEFDDLFSTITGYDALDKRIAKTKAKKLSLLMVLVLRLREETEKRG